MNYAGILRFFEIVIVTLLYRSCSTIKFFDSLRSLSIRKTSLLPCFVTLIHCSVFKVQIPVRTLALTIIFSGSPSLWPQPRGRIYDYTPRCARRVISDLTIRFEDPTSKVRSSNPTVNLFGGPEWARTTDLTIISRTL